MGKAGKEKREDQEKKKQRQSGWAVISQHVIAIITIYNVIYGTQLKCNANAIEIRLLTNFVCVAYALAFIKKQFIDWSTHLHLKWLLIWGTRTRNQMLCFGKSNVFSIYWNFFSSLTLQQDVLRYYTNIYFELVNQKKKKWYVFLSFEKFPGKFSF